VARIGLMTSLVAAVVSYVLALAVGTALVIAAR
jgi:hypothetical protein